MFKMKQNVNMEIPSMALENPMAGHVITICIEQAIIMEQ
jgi:hypothetical protein